MTVFLGFLQSGNCGMRNFWHIPLVENEQFDFDLSLSPNNNEENSVDGEDEVFFGPVNHREKCVRAHNDIDSVKPLSPLTNEQYAELFKEAIGLVMELQQDETDAKKKSSSGETEEFISKTLEKLQLSKQYDSSPDIPSNRANKSPITESKCFKREQKKEIRSPRRQTYTISSNKNVVGANLNASECVSKLKPKSNVVFKAKGGVQKQVPKPSTKSNSRTTNKSNVPKKKQECLGFSPPKRTRKNSLCSDDGISDTSSIMSDVSEASTSSIPVPGRKRSLPLSKKSGLILPSERGSTSKVPTNKLMLMKPGTIQRRTLSVTRTAKTDSVSKGPNQPLKAVVSLNSTKKSTPVKLQPGKKEFGKTPQINMSSAKNKPQRNTPQPNLSAAKNAKPRSTPQSNMSNVKGSQLKKSPQLCVSATNSKKGMSRLVMPSTPVFQEKKVVPKRIIACSAKKDNIKAKSTSPPSAYSAKATPATLSKLSASSTGSARRRSGIPTPMRSNTTKSRVFTFSNVDPPSPIEMRMSSTGSSVSDSAPSPDVFTKTSADLASMQEISASPACTKVSKEVKPHVVNTEKSAGEGSKLQTSEPKHEEGNKSTEPIEEQMTENQNSIKNGKKVLDAKVIQQEHAPTSCDAKMNALKSSPAKTPFKSSPAKTPLLIDLSDSKVKPASPFVKNLINFGDTPDINEPTKKPAVSDKENLLIVI